MSEYLDGPHPLDNPFGFLLHAAVGTLTGRVRITRADLRPRGGSTQRGSMGREWVLELRLDEEPIDVVARAFERVRGRLRDGGVEA